MKKRTIKTNVILGSKRLTLIQKENINGNAVFVDLKIVGSDGTVKFSSSIGPFVAPMKTVFLEHAFRTYVDLMFLNFLSN
ncbi:hypothetical protein [Ligilactobacillus agilis]|uniref:hypothetical protein n=1 Tax=Ligilactobacillus agilis TaxID=1601 RepID=UPI0018694C81|nr:hypothetical protein [Ligilactobacillus agilis]